MENLNSLAVFCGSKSGCSESYSLAAKELGEELALRRIKLVYGGGNEGIMGDLANSVLDTGGQVVGVIPNFLDDLEVAHGNLTELIRVESMHIRKQKMFNMADGFVVLPGGLGTLDECFEIITWKQLNIHSKPIILLNIEGCWNSFETLVSDIFRAGFGHRDISELFTIVSSVKEVFALLEYARGR